MLGGGKVLGLPLEEDGSVLEWGFSNTEAGTCPVLRNSINVVESLNSESTEADTVDIL